MIIEGQIEPNASFMFTVDSVVSIQRIDQYLALLFPHYSRSFFQKLITDKYVSRNGTVMTKPSTPISPADVIEVRFPPTRIVEPSTVMQETTNVSVLETTEHFMIIYKPPHLLVHPPSLSSKAITLTDWIRHNHAEIAQVGIVDRPGIVHRLDKDTSGIMIVTKTNYAQNVFSNLFKERAIQKTYLALVEGHPDKEGTIALPIGRDPFNRTKMRAFSEDNLEELCKKHAIKIRHALTDYKVVRYFEDSALVEIKPTTGRTHQIRVHMAALGHPIIGDTVYGKTSAHIDRQALHAYSLEFVFDEQRYFFSYDVPQDFQQLLTAVKPVVDQ